MTAAYHIVTTAKLALFATTTVVVNSYNLPFARRGGGVVLGLGSNPRRSPLLPPLVPLVGAGDDGPAAATGGSRGASCRKSLRVEIDEGDNLTFDPDGPRITFRARKRYQTAVDEGDVIIPDDDDDDGGGGGSEQPRLRKRRTLLEYLALPTEEYSVLDAGTIVKKEGRPNEFTCAVDPISFLGNEIVATIDAVVDVSPYPEGKSVIRVVGCTLGGSRLAEYANGSFDVDCTNVVMALREDTRKARDVPTLAVDCSLEISALVPREGRWLPKRLLGKSGSIVMQQMLNVLVPRFVRQLAADYDAWSLGDDSRAPVAVTVDDSAGDGSALGRDAATAVNGNGAASMRRQQQETG